MPHGYRTSSCTAQRCAGTQKASVPHQHPCGLCHPVQRLGVSAGTLGRAEIGQVAVRLPLPHSANLTECH